MGDEMDGIGIAPGLAGFDPLADGHRGHFLNRVFPRRIVDIRDPVTVVL